jgi:NADPH:quinone reductase-like Zn-dependent oxidoreductase
MARHGRLRPVVARTFPLVEAALAQAELETRRHVGKLVLVP